MREPAFSLHVAPAPFEAVVRVEGASDGTAGPVLRRCLDELVDVGTTVIVVDLAACQALDESDVGALVAASQWLNGRGRNLVVADPQPSVQDLFRATEADRVLAVRRGPRRRQRPRREPPGAIRVDGAA